MLCICYCTKSNNVILTITTPNPGFAGFSIAQRIEHVAMCIKLHQLLLLDSGLHVDGF